MKIGIYDDSTKIKLQVPENWKKMDRIGFKEFGISDNTIFLFLNQYNQLISIVCDGKCNEDELNKAYKTNIDTLNKKGIRIVAEFYKIKPVRLGIIKYINHKKLRIHIESSIFFKWFILPITNCLGEISSKLHYVEEKVIEGLKIWLQQYRFDYQENIEKINNSKIQSIKETILSLEAEVNKEKAVLIPKVENLLDVYDLLKTPEEKNDLLKSVLTQVTYLKTEKAIKKDSDPTNFIINLYPKINKTISWF